MQYHSFPDDKTTDMLEQSILYNMSAKKIKLADSQPWNLLLPYLHASLQEFAGYCFFHDWANSGVEFGDTTSYLNMFKVNSSKRRDMICSMENISRFFTRHGMTQDKMATEWQEVMEDYQALIKQSTRIYSDIHGDLQAMQSSDAINESKLAIKQADSVRRSVNPD
jgi:hypothetical protein